MEKLDLKKIKIKIFFKKSEVICTVEFNAIIQNVRGYLLLRRKNKKVKGNICGNLTRQGATIKMEQAFNIR